MDSDLRRDWLLEAACEQLEPCSACFRAYVLALIEADIGAEAQVYGPPTRREELVERMRDAVEDSKWPPDAPVSGVVDVALVPKPVDLDSRRCANCGRPAKPGGDWCRECDPFDDEPVEADAPPVNAEGNGSGPVLPVAVDQVEARAREWIEDRIKSASGGMGEGASRISITDLMMLTGWERSRAVKFVSAVLDEISKPTKLPSGAVSLGKLIQQIAAGHGEDDDDTAAEEAFLSCEQTARSPVPGRVLRAGCETLREYNALCAARRAAKSRNRPFDDAQWIAEYRTRRGVTP